MLRPRNTTADEAAPATGAPAFLAPLRRSRWAALGLVTVAGAASGALWGLLAPRGPLSAAGGLAVMATGLILGAVAGVLVRQRRAMVAVLLAHVGALELARWPIDGPTVDGIHLGSPYGVIAFLTGRGFQGALLALPALVGVAYGAGLARRWSGQDPSRRRWATLARRGIAAASAVALLGLTVLVACPATTEAIPGPGGKPLAGSVAELTAVRVGGHDTTVMLRGHSAEAPVLVYLAGGPGGTDLGAMRLFGERLERDFVVATWDQRGAGTSYGALDPTSTLTLDRAVRDTIEVVEWLRKRFDEDRVYLVGNSWGTILGVLAAQQRPDLFAAYVGTGQMASPTETDRIFYSDTLAWARRTGNRDLARTLERQGPPPYDDLFAYEPALSHEHEWNPYPMLPAYADGGEMPFNLAVEEYDLVQKVHGLAAFLDTFAVLYPQLRDVDFRRQATSLEVPVYVVTGEHEPRGRAEPSRQWFDALQAPTKQWITVPQSGHRPHFEQPDRFADLMSTVLADTRSPSTSGSPPPTGG